MPRYLIQQRRTWYAILEIPKDCQSKFKKNRFKKTLKTESLTVAEKRVLPIIAQWKQQIDTARLSSSTIETKKLDWLILADEERRNGVSEDGIRELSAEISSVLRHDDPDMIEVHETTFGSWITLSDHIDVWSDSLDNAPKTVDMKKNDATRFAKSFKYAHDATNIAVMDWVESQLIAKERLSYTTCRRIISACRDYWKYLRRHKKLTLAHPFSGVVPVSSSKKTKTQVKSNRKGFGPRDYNKLIKAVPQNDQSLSDLIQLGAYTGARIDELCSLKLENVHSDHFEIEDAKTEAGWRVIPIHAHIKDLVTRLQSQSFDGYLISGLTFNKYNDRSNAIGKRFGRLKGKCEYGPDYVFHSFRKGVATQLENAQVPENISARLLGHELKTMSYGLYSGGLKLDTLANALGVLDWNIA